MEIGVYLNEVRALAASGQATEHSYRPALQRLFRSVDAGVTVINEPKRMAEVGNPEFALHHKINASLGTQSYFCHIRSPWEKGGVENSAGGG